MVKRVKLSQKDDNRLPGKDWLPVSRLNKVNRAKNLSRIVPVLIAFSSATLNSKVQVRVSKLKALKLVQTLWSNPEY